MRRTIQLLSLSFFIYLFFRAAYPLTSTVPVDLFLRADPLNALITSLASREVMYTALPALILIVLTLLFGRFFCGYLCPLGTLLDLFSTRFASNRPRFVEQLRGMKFYLLIGLTVAALCGANALYFFDPLVILTRTFTILLYPLSVFLANLSLDWLRPLADARGWITLTYLHYDQPFFSMGLVTGIIFIALLLLNYVTPRFWCRYLCPLGALLACLLTLRHV